NGTTSVTARCGKSCAVAPAVALSAITADATSVFIAFIRLLLQGRFMQSTIGFEYCIQIWTCRQNPLLDGKIDQHLHRCPVLLQTDPIKVMSRPDAEAIAGQIASLPGDVCRTREHVRYFLRKPRMLIDQILADDHH